MKKVGPARTDGPVLSHPDEEKMGGYGSTLRRKFTLPR